MLLNKHKLIAFVLLFFTLFLGALIIRNMMRWDRIMDDYFGQYEDYQTPRQGEVYIK